MIIRVFILTIAHEYQDVVNFAGKAWNWLKSSFIIIYFGNNIIDQDVIVRVFILAVAHEYQDVVDFPGKAWNY